MMRARSSSACTHTTHTHRHTGQALAAQTCYKQAGMCACRICIVCMHEGGAGLASFSALRYTSLNTLLIKAMRVFSSTSVVVRVNRIYSANMKPSSCESPNCCKSRP